MPNCIRNMVAETPVMLLTPLARADLEDIWRYTAATWSMRQAMTIFMRLPTGIEFIRILHRAGAAADISSAGLSRVSGSYYLGHGAAV